MSETYISVELRRLARERANDSCEYCLIPESFSLGSHQIDHVIAEKHGGRTDAGNLACCCIICNRRKGSDIASVDWQTEQIEALFNPRIDNWSSHFLLDEGRIEPLTGKGRATATLLRFNVPNRVKERRLLIALGVLAIPLNNLRQ